MNAHIKKIIRISVYTALLAVGFFVALFPFLKKDKEYITNFSPTVRDAMADIPAPTEVGGDGDGGDGGSMNQL